MKHLIGLLAWVAIFALPLLAPVAEWLTPKVTYRPFPWDEPQQENGGQE